MYKRQIYYISNELDTMGIYSMDMDGSNVQLEVKNPSVTNLQWRNDTLYFVGLENIEDNTDVYKRQGYSYILCG